jgi:hypothetical protein
LYIYKCIGKTITDVNKIFFVYRHVFVEHGKKKSAIEWVRFKR